MRCFLGITSVGLETEDRTNLLRPKSKPMPTSIKPKEATDAKETEDDIWGPWTSKGKIHERARERQRDNVVVGAIGARASHTWATLCLNRSIAVYIYICTHIYINTYLFEYIYIYKGIASLLDTSIYNNLAYIYTKICVYIFIPIYSNIYIYN